MKGTHLSHQSYDLSTKYRVHDSETNNLLGECGLSLLKFVFILLTLLDLEIFASLKEIEWSGGGRFFTRVRYNYLLQTAVLKLMGTTRLPELAESDKPAVNDDTTPGTNSQAMNASPPLQSNSGNSQPEMHYRDTAATARSCHRKSILGAARLRVDRRNAIVSANNDEELAQREAHRDRN
jgi:hypothetical protein